jgi:hypothetical protein
MRISPIAILALSAAIVSSASAQAPKEHSMTGCLQKGAEPGTYLVTDVEGNGPKTIGVVSSTANLAPHVGHKIEVTGTAVPAKEAEAEKNVPKAQHYMKLTAIKMISASGP